MERRKDENYVALNQIERSMKNEISTLSMSNTRLLTYLHAMESSVLGINGALKALSMLAAIDEKMQEPDSAEMVRAWMHALYRASKNPVRAQIFKTVVFDQPVYPEFERECSLNDALDELESHESWRIVLGAAGACALMVALSVFFFHVNFFFSLLLFLGVYLLILAYCFFWMQPRREVQRLKLLTRPMTPFVQSFVRSLKLANYGPVPDRHSLMRISRAALSVFFPGLAAPKTRPKARRSKDSVSSSQSILADPLFQNLHAASPEAKLASSSRSSRTRPSSRPASRPMAAYFEDRPDASFSAGRSVKSAARRPAPDSLGATREFHPITLDPQEGAPRRPKAAPSKKSTPPRRKSLLMNLEDDDFFFSTPETDAMPADVLEKRRGFSKRAAFSAGVF